MKKYEVLILISGAVTIVAGLRKVPVKDYAAFEPFSDENNRFNVHFTNAQMYERQRLTVSVPPGILVN